MSLDWDWIWQMHRYCIRPDVTVFVDVPVEVCLERMAKGRSQQDLFENRRVLTRARESYMRAIDRLRASEERIEVLDGDQPLEQVRNAVWAVVSPPF
jgi:dTMP kinase